MRGEWRLALLLAAVVTTGCGGGERQDAGEPEGSFRLRVTQATFPAEQSLAERSTLRIRVRNADTRTVPNVAVTIETAARQAGGAAQAFSQNRDDQALADPSRPVWIVDRAPRGGVTAHTNTWALGPLPGGRSRTFEWRVTPVSPGTYRIAYQVAAGLHGKAEVAAGRGKGEFRVRIEEKPAQARIAEDGKTVVRPGD